MAKQTKTPRKPAIKDGKAEDTVVESVKTGKTKKVNTKEMKAEKPNVKYVSNLRKTSVRDSVGEAEKVIRKKRRIDLEESSGGESEDVAPKKRKKVTEKVEENVSDSSDEEEVKKSKTKKKTVCLGVRGAEKQVSINVPSTSNSSEEECGAAKLNLSADIDEVIRKYASGPYIEDNETGVSGDDMEQESDEDVETNDEVESDEFAKIGEKDKKTRQKWPSKLEKKLVELWEEEDHLYDTTCKQYRRTHLRVAALNRFAAVLKLDVNDVKVHMESLWTAYRKILKLPSGSSADRLTARQREICDLCKFLQRHLQNRESQSNVKKPAKRSSKEKDEDSSDEIEPPNKGKYTKKTKPKGLGKKKSEELTDDTSETPDSDGKTPAYYVKSKYKKQSDAKKKKLAMEEKQTRSDLLTDLTSSVSTLVQSNVSKGKEDPPDSTDLWAKILADKIKNMDKKVGERFKLHVDTIALDAMEGVWPKK